MVVIASSVSAIRSRWRQGLKGVSPIHEVTGRAELETSLAELNPSVLLLDLALPQLGGVRGVPAIHRRNPSTKVILLTNTPNEREGIAALKAGASGYCPNDLNPFLVKRAVEQVQKGEIWIGRYLIPHLLEELTALSERRRRASLSNPDRRLDVLSPRELEIANLIGDGASNKEIASRLNVTERTVKAHLTAVFRKLGFSDRLRLALFVTEHNLKAR
ncbi:MAG: LuxR C-terminal-related transcriptional regulator [Candidatus Binatia bacterium]